MRYLYVFNTDLVEIPYAVWDGVIKYTLEEQPIGIEISMGKDNDIFFNEGVTGFGYNTEGIKDYESLLGFLIEHYDEIKENNEDNLTFTRHELVDELIEICKEKIKLYESN